MISKKRLLITGASGFIGANLVRRLINQGNRIHVLIKSESDIWRLKDIKNQIIFHHASLEDLGQLKRIVKKTEPEIIYHLAAHGSYPFQNNPIKIISTNILGTTNLLIALNLINYRCFINTGSSSEYGFKSKPMKESDSLEPVSFYAITKISTTHLCRVFAKTFNKPIITFRPFSVYGPYEEPTRLIPTVITRIFRGQPVELTGKEAKRDFIFIDDVVDCYINSVNNIKRKIYGEVFNVGTGKQYSNKEVVNIIAKILKRNVKIKTGAYQNRSWDTNFWVANCVKTKKELNWRSKFSLESGLLETIKWFKSYEDKSRYYQKT